MTKDDYVFIAGCVFLVGILALTSACRHGLFARHVVLVIAS